MQGSYFFLFLPSHQEMVWLPESFHSSLVLLDRQYLVILGVCPPCYPGSSWGLKLVLVVLLSPVPIAEVDI